MGSQGSIKKVPKRFWKGFALISSKFTKGSMGKTPGRNLNIDLLSWHLTKGFGFQCSGKG